MIKSNGYFLNLDLTFICVNNLCMHTAKALARLHINELILAVADAVSTKSICTSSFDHERIPNQRSLISDFAQIEQ